MGLLMSSTPSTPRTRSAAASMPSPWIMDCISSSLMSLAIASVITPMRWLNMAPL